MHRRRFLAVAGAAAAGIAAEAFALEPRRLVVRRHAVPIPVPFRFVQLSDLHLRRVGGVHRALAREAARARPELILITGDSVDQPDALPLLAEFLALLDPAVPKYAVLGNWEHWSGTDLAALRRVYADANARLLVNESVKHGTVRITGLDDLVGGRPDLHAALGSAPLADAHLLLCHCPAHRDLFAGQAAGASIGTLEVRPAVDPGHLRGTLVLSGHTHGGQVSLGGFAPLRPPGSGRYVAGMYEDPGAPPMYVSRGVGMSVLPVRLGSPPELTVFERV